MSTTAAPALTCEARTGFYPGEWSEMPIWCNATVGLRSWVDSNGRTHRACRHHVVALMGRYPMRQWSVDMGGYIVTVDEAPE